MSLVYVLFDAQIRKYIQNNTVNLNPTNKIQSTYITIVGN